MSNARLSNASSTDLSSGEIRPGIFGFARKSRASQIIRRRPTLEQGRALEILGHAVEYLIDSRMPLPAQSADQLAVQTLMRLSREVFAECAAIVPMHRRLRWWADW